MTAAVLMRSQSRLRPRATHSPSDPDVVSVTAHKVTDLSRPTSDKKLEHGWIEITVDMASAAATDRLKKK